MYQDKNGKKFDDFGPLTDIITSTVDTKTWVDNGGNGTILGASLGTAKILVVDHRYEVQKKIAALLAEIRTIAVKKSGGGDLPRRKRPTTMQNALGMGARRGNNPGSPPSLEGGSSGSGPYLGTEEGSPRSKPADGSAGTSSSNSPSPSPRAKK